MLGPNSGLVSCGDPANVLRPFWLWLHLLAPFVVERLRSEGRASAAQEELHYNPQHMED